jgi:hypothetical protein
MCFYMVLVLLARESRSSVSGEHLHTTLLQPYKSTLNLQLTCSDQSTFNLHRSCVQFRMLLYGWSMFLLLCSMQYVAVGFLQLSLSLSTNYMISGFAPLENGYSEYPSLTTTIYHIKTHCWIQTTVYNY